MPKWLTAPFGWVWRTFFRREGNAALSSEDYDGSFHWFPALAPTIWLMIVGGCLLLALAAVGYLSLDPELKGSAGKATASPFAKFEEAFPKDADFAKRRAALAFSGVTLAVTFALAITSAFWAGKAFMGKANRYRYVVLLWTAALFALCLGILWWMHTKEFQPFASEIANKLLEKAYPDAKGCIGVPEVMFGLACALPAVLAAGACFLMQPVRSDGTPDEVKKRLERLIARLRELDQLLYVGALTLVFGTLQLSSGMSVPLTSMPNAPDLKIKAELCKSVSPASPASSPFITPRETVRRGSYYEGFDVEECRKVPQEFARVSVADDLRQLARGITLSFGLAFSALLAAIYVPSLIGMSMMIEALQQEVRKTPSAPAVGTNEAPKEDKVDAGDVDPLRRVAAAFATLSPLIASLLANAFATG